MTVTDQQAATRSADSTRGLSSIFDRRARVIVLGAVLLVLAVLGTVVSVSLAGCSAECPPARASAPAGVVTLPPPIPATMTITLTPAARDVDPLGTVAVTATTGTLTDVSMLNEQGNRIVGVMTPDNTVWKPGVPLGYGRTYTLTATGAGTDGAPVTQVSTFSTLTPGNQTKVYLNTTAGTALRDGGTYGIGTVIAAHFDEPITDRAAAERRLSVTTSPSVAGSWYWLDDQNAHWRPQRYFAPGTAVTANANIYAIPLGEGLYGQEDSRVRFTIGNAHVSIADDRTKQVSVYDNGALVRTMPTSMGMGGSETIGGQTISFWTQPGIYTVMDKANPVIMDSSTFGLPINSRLGYRENHQLRHPNQHRRRLPAPTRSHGVGARQHQRLARLLEPQRRQRPMVLRLLPTRRRRRSPQHRRGTPTSVAERRLEHAVGAMVDR
ncbi:lipoprotein-anchoring transpeptidase ErfK/SrfK [Mycobacterium sp. AZCC_0083]|nr:lipoprotein-anchoring transpeptidase ErfK/SrfK [Mycobacterium sp. AZCC_0083]